MKKNIRICIVIGTRPEIIKMSPVIKECKKRKLDYFVIHTGQHYSYNMDSLFMKEFGLPKAKYNLAVGSASHAVQTARILEGIETILLKEKPDVVLVQGDTNSVLAGALAASKLNIRVGHIEAGLRSNDRTMPEETNRVITDHISDFLFTPTSFSQKLLESEGIQKGVYNVGNTVVDVVFENIEHAKKISTVLEVNNLISKKYILVTSHRAENVDNKIELKNIIEGISKIQKYSGLKIVWPMHPRTLSNIKKFKLAKMLSAISNTSVIEPVGYFDSLVLQTFAKVVLTDSGGLQEESCIVGTPCITLRANTERPESVLVGANILTGTDSAAMLRAYRRCSSADGKWKNPFGDGNSAKRIIDVLLKRI